MIQKSVILPGKLKKDIERQISSEGISIAKFAVQQGLPVRTLQRRLNDAGLTFSQLVDESRFNIARHELKSGKKNIATIARELGFTDASNFSRAFYRWSGITPSKYRAKYKKAGKTKARQTK